MITRINAYRITLLALLLWCSSIFLPALATYNKSIYGYEILVTGWLGPFKGEFSWYANIFFLFATIQLLKNKSIPLHSSYFAVILSANMFLFSDFLYEAGSTRPIYGYGIGSILWVISILLIFFAANLKVATQKKDTVLKNISLVLIIALVTSSLWFAVQDRVNANAQEKERLSRVVFKRGPVCTANTAIAMTQLRLNGPLELISDSNEFLFYNAEQLLNWGIPVVRFRDEDYYIGIIADKPKITSRPAHGQSAAILESNSLRASGNKSFTGYTSLKMYSPDRKVIVFEQSWNREHSGIYCPDFHSFPKENEQPRKLIMSAFKKLGD